jgi:hypothetical protein
MVVAVMAAFAFAGIRPAADFAGEVGRYQGFGLGGYHPEDDLHAII